jgi:hypothetical protein
MEDCVANMMKIGDLIYLGEILAIAFAHAEHGPPGAEHLFPE